MKICNNCKYFGKQKKTHSFICGNSKSKLFNISSSHKKTRKACSFYKPTANFRQIKGMRFIDNYRNTISGSAWIIGCDSNVDFYPDDFFQDKLSITLNWAYRAFPNSTYFCAYHSCIADAIREEYPDSLHKCLFPLRPKKLIGGAGLLWWDDFGLDPIYLIRRRYDSNRSKKSYEKTIQQTLDDGPCEFVGGGSILVYAIQVAAILGAKKIILVGCSCKCGKYHEYAQNRGVGPSYVEKPLESYFNYQTGEYDNEAQTRGLPVYRRTRREIDRFVEIFKDCNIEITRHRFDEGKNKFVFEEIELGRDRWLPDLYHLENNEYNP